MKFRSFLRGLFWSLVALALVVHIAGSWYFSGVLIDEAFTPNPDPMPAAAAGAEETTYATPLGDMDAWHLEGDKSLWVIHVHGLGATPEEAEHLFGPIQDEGFPQLAITYRNDDGQPKDPTGLYQYGATEWEDIQGAVNYAKANGARGVALIGYSTGASHILSFAYRFGIDDIKGMVFDSPNINLGDTVEFAAGQREMPLLPMNVPVTLTWTSKFVTALRIGINWRSLDYITRAERSLRSPVLVVHGTDDLRVPISQSVDFVEAAPELVRLITFEGAEHVGSFDVDPETYLREVLAFLNSVDR